MSKKAFTLIEIMLVMAILTLLSTVVIPISLRARHNANEVAAIASLRTINTACTSFFATQTPPTYPANLGALGSDIPPYIDAALANAASSATARRGYFYAYTLVNANQFTCTATPAISSTTGTRVFFMDETGIVRLNNSAGASVE